MLFGNEEVRKTATMAACRKTVCGKLPDSQNEALNEIKKLVETHIWYTGVIAHASQTDYSATIDLATILLL